MPEGRLWLIRDTYATETRWARRPGTATGQARPRERRPRHSPLGLRRPGARWTGRILRVEVEGWVDPGLTVSSADALGRQVARTIASELPEAGSFTWTARAAPA
jgi:hypothetical protein